ncbi:hypothetical protein M199_gp143 [Halogranum tailed virus 1]|uniref:Uncharacterized protein n=1 Tax=Halogranum tailed virus 1 TaxID=1273749 RepID=R4TMV5_9CAUD|nr:hypothetical protein M199_gp143 [Halogranum tailed virus 1]AGM11523.1 hypothetical protein HGTV1_226 [Halogranum tailed virus 1]
MNREKAEQIAEEYFDEYTIDHRMFQDGDERWLIVHNVGWSSSDYVTITIWLTRERVQVEWFEDDRRVSTEWHDFWHWERGDVFGKYRA